MITFASMNCRDGDFIGKSIYSFDIPFPTPGNYREPAAQVETSAGPPHWRSGVDWPVLDSILRWPPGQGLPVFCPVALRFQPGPGIAPLSTTPGSFFLLRHVHPSYGWINKIISI